MVNKLKKESGSPAALFPVSEESARGLVLFVDDDEIMRTVGEAVLRSLNFQVLTASTGEEGVELFKQHHHQIEIVLMDMVMPGIDGDEAFHEMRRISPDARVLICSGSGREDKVASIMKSGAAGFIQKPYRRADLAASILNIIERKDNSRQRI